MLCWKNNKTQRARTSGDATVFQMLKSAVLVFYTNDIYYMAVQPRKKDPSSVVLVTCGVWTPKKMQEAQELKYKINVFNRTGQTKETRSEHSCGG